MRHFEHVNATSVAGAVSLLARDGRASPIAGGTDLLTRMKLGIARPERLVNLKTIRELDRIDFNGAGLDLGALVTLDAIAADPAVRERYPLLVRAIEVAASPQLRNAGTIGGNLAQASRCWYYRGRFDCWLKGGEVCYARDGENSRHAIFGGGPCYTVHPSDPAPALIALGAAVSTAGPKGERTRPLEELFQVPGEDSRRLAVLEAGELITGVHLPAPAPGSRGTYLKAMERKVWEFALASVAALLVFEGDVIREARVVLGGVAPKPWRLPQTEAALRGRRLGPEVIGRAAELAAEGAQPLEHNRYKVGLVKGIVAEALSTI